MRKEGKIVRGKNHRKGMNLQTLLSLPYKVTGDIDQVFQHFKFKRLKDSLLSYWSLGLPSGC